MCRAGVMRKPALAKADPFIGELAVQHRQEPGHGHGSGHRTQLRLFGLSFYSMLDSRCQFGQALQVKQHHRISFAVCGMAIARIVRVSWRHGLLPPAHGRSGRNPTRRLNRIVLADGAGCACRRDQQGGSGSRLSVPNSEFKAARPWPVSHFAFVIGFSIEIFFSLLDRFVQIFNAHFACTRCAGRSSACTCHRSRSNRPGDRRVASRLQRRSARHGRPDDVLDRPGAGRQHDEAVEAEREPLRPPA